MKRWATKPLGEVLEISRERVEPGENPENLFNYVGLESIEGHTGKLLAYQPTPGAEIKSTKNAFHAGDILYGKLRPYLNKVHFAESDGICSTDIYVLRPIERQVHPLFAANFLRSPPVLAFVSNSMAGANLPRIGQDSLLGIPMPVPPLVEQERIVKLLEEADELRKLRAQADQRTGQFIPALFHEMFGVPLDKAPPYPVKEIGKLVRDGDKINYGVVQPGDEVAYGVPVVRAGDFSGMTIDKSHLKRISPEIEKDYVRSRLRGDEILISCVGSIGGIALADSTLKGFNIVRAVARVPLRDDIDRVFVANQLMTQELQSFFRRETRTVAQPTLNIRQIEETPIILPPLPLQKEFAKRVAEIREMEAAQAASRRRTEDLFQSMLHKAFTGEL